MSTCEEAFDTAVAGTDSGIVAAVAVGSFSLMTRCTLGGPAKYLPRVTVQLQGKVLIGSLAANPSIETDADKRADD